MEFKIGHTKRPKEIEESGLVIFEHLVRNGTEEEPEEGYTMTEVAPTEDECKAYGFRWMLENSYQDARCSCNYPSIEKLNIKPFSSNLEVGADNHLFHKTQSSAAIGRRNVTGVSTDNNLISGWNNEINDRVHNSVVSGTRGNASVDNQYVQGGNAIVDGDTDMLGKRQYSRVIFARQTNNGNTKGAYLNNKPASKYPIPINSAIHFKCSILAVRVGGDGEEGNIGDYGAWLERGVVINRNGVCESNRTRKTIGTSGETSTWRATALFTGTDFYVSVRGAADYDIDWVITCQLTELRTGVDLSEGREE